VATPRQILVNQLLLEREALWVRVHEIEREAAKWLGEPYPFERLELPSDRKKKRRAAGGAGSPAGAGRGESAANPDTGVARPEGGAGAANATVRPEPGATAAVLRRLESGEAGYRVSYAAHGRAATEEHDELDALRVAVASQGAHLRVTRIETVDANGAVRATLFPV